jgi:hypothetical protein
MLTYTLDVADKNILAHPSAFSLRQQGTSFFIVYLFLPERQKRHTIGLSLAGRFSCCRRRKRCAKSVNKHIFRDG